MNKSRIVMLATIVVFLFVLTAQAGASVMAAAGVRSDSAFTTTGGVYAEGPFGAGKYAWYVDQTDHEAILRGFDQSDPANPNQLAEVNGRSGVGAGRIGSVSGVAFQPSGDKLLVLDKAYDRLIIFPRKNDGSTADPVSYPNAGTRHLVEPWFLFYPWWSGLEAPGGLAVDAGDSGRVYISDTGHGRIITLDKDFDWIGEQRQSDWNSTVKPGALAVDKRNGRVYASIEGAARIDVFTKDLETRLQPLSSPTSGDFIALSADPSSNRLFAAKRNEIDVFSLTTGTLLGSVTGISFDNSLLGISAVENSRNFHVSSSGSDHAQAYRLNLPPVCTLPATPLSVTAGESVTFTPSCDDADHSTLKEFSIEGTPARGTATLAANRGSITFAATAGGSGADIVKFKVMTQDGLSAAYEYPINVVKGPSLTVSAPAQGATLGSPVTATFTATDASSVTCKWDSESTISPCASPLGPKSLGAGGHTFTVTALNAAGTSTSVTRTFTVIAQPTVSISAPTEAQVLGSPVTASFSLGGGAASTVTCQWDSEAAISPCTSPLAPKTLTPGPHALKVSASNVAGTASATRNFTVLAAPTVSITAPAAGAEFGSPVSASFSLGGGAASTVTCQWDSEAAISPCTSPLAPKSLTPGPHALKLSVSNVAGSASATRNFTVLAAPTVAITAPDADEELGSPVTASFTLGGGAASTVTCQWDSEAAISPCTSPLGPKTFTPGPHSLKVSASNVAGSDDDTHSFTVTEEPTVSITAPADDEEVGSPVAPKFTLGGGAPTTVTCQFDSEPVISPCTSPLAPTDLGAGEHSLTVTASNIAGSDSATRSFTVLAEPTLSITSPTEDEEEVGSPVSPTFTLGGGAPTTVTCQFDSEPVVDPCTSPLDPVELEPGEHTITVTATNVGGTATVTRDFTVVEPPKVSITAPSNVQVVGSPATATFTIEGGTPNDVSCQWDDEPVITPCASPQGPKALSPGSHTFTVTATNAAEVVSVTSKFSIAANVQAAAVEGPVVRESTNLQLDSGDVFVKVPGSDAFVKLTKDMLVPIGTLIDATDGKAHITLANKDKSLYDGIFWGGVFEVKQGTGDNPIATMKLRPGFGVQGATANAAHAMISGHSTAELERGFKVWTSRRRGKKKGGVWGDAHGKFRTSGSGGSATVNGTRWYVANYENGSLFKVSRGVVTVKPLHCPAFKLTAGHSEFLYLENSKKHKKKRKHPLKRKCASE